MARIKFKDPSDAYREVRKVGSKLGEGKRDCAVVAVSIATGRPYEECLNVMTKHGRRPGHGTPMAVTNAAMNELGFELTKLSWIKLMEIIKGYPGVHSNLKNVTSHHPRRFPGAFDHLGPVFMMRSNGHISTVKNGVNEDWSQNSALRVIEIYVVKAKQG
jgi:hypothetical protein